MEKIKKLRLFAVLAALAALTSCTRNEMPQFKDKGRPPHHQRGVLHRALLDERSAEMEYGAFNPDVQR